MERLRAYVHLMLWIGCTLEASIASNHEPVQKCLQHSAHLAWLSFATIGAEAPHCPKSSCAGHTPTCHCHHLWDTLHSQNQYVACISTNAAAAEWRSVSTPVLTGPLRRAVEMCWPRAASCLLQPSRAWSLHSTNNHQTTAAVNLSNRAQVQQAYTHSESVQFATALQFKACKWRMKRTRLYIKHRHNNLNKLSRCVATK